MNPFAYLYLFYAGTVMWNKKGYLKKMVRVNPIVFLALIPIIRLIIENTIWINAWEGFFAILFIASILNLSSTSILLTLLRNKYLTSFGIRTYGFYLIHFPILYIIATLMLDNFSYLALFDYPIIFLCVASLLSIALAAYLSYKVIYPIELFFMKQLPSGHFFKKRLALD